MTYIGQYAIKPNQTKPNQTKPNQNYGFFVECSEKKTWEKKEKKLSVLKKPLLMGVRIHWLNILRRDILT